MKKMIVVVNSLLIFCFVTVWVIDMFRTINYDSILFNREISTDNRMPVYAGVIILIILFLFLAWSFFKRNITYSEIFCVICLSTITLLVLKNDINSYSPWQHNENFILVECIYIYYSFVALLLSLISGVYTLLKK